MSAIELRGVGVTASLGIGTVQVADAVAAGAEGFRSVTETGWAGVDGEIYEGGFLESEVLGDLHRKVRDVPPYTLHARVLQLGGAALAQLRPYLDDDVPVPVILGVPDHPRVPTADLVQQLMRQAQLRLDLDASAVVVGGQGAGLLAIHRACLELQAGREGPIIAGGIDSWFDYRRLLDRDIDDRRAGRNADGRHRAGEAAGLLLLGRGAALVEPAAPTLWIEASSAQDAKLALPVALLGGRALMPMPAALRSCIAPNTAPTATIQPCMPLLGASAPSGLGPGACGVCHGQLLADPPPGSLPCPVWQLGDLGAAMGPALLGLAAHGLVQSPATALAHYCLLEDGRGLALLTSPGPLQPLPKEDP